MFPGLPGITPQFAGVSAGSNADTRSLPLAEVAIASILAAGLWALQTRSWRADGVAHEDCGVQIDKPSIAYWRDHSAGASRRRVTPMPRGSRPSTAAFTRSGARNASEIVILTCRMLHFRNLRAFPQVQMRTCGLCRWLRSR